MRKLLFLLPLTATALAAGTLASAAPTRTPTVDLTIRHQVRGCHTWSVAGGRFAATQRLRISRGTVLRVVNADVMPHRLIQRSGPRARITHARMGHMMAAATVRFPRTGVHRFVTRAGEDYSSMGHMLNMGPMRTVGEDYVLRLTVVVS